MHIVHDGKQPGAQVAVVPPQVKLAPRPLQSVLDQVIGAVGISGDVSDKDEACAVAGIQAAQLTADTGA